MFKPRSHSIFADVTYDIPQLKLPRGNFGCVLSHREAWKRLINSTHEFAIVLEDDCPPTSRDAMLVFPPIPAVCDYTMLTPTIANRQKQVKLCNQTDVYMMLEGYSTGGYILHRRAAMRLLDRSVNGYVDLVYDVRGCLDHMCKCNKVTFSCKMQT